MAQDTRQLLEAKVRDCLRMAQRRPCFLGFLDESQRAQCQDLLKWEKGTSFLFWGGYDQAERTMLGFFPDYLEPSAQEFPLEAVTFRYRAGDKLSHRDFLGSFMALGVERDVLGDILVGEGCCVAFLRREMAPYFLDNIRKIGRVGVKASLGAEEPLPVRREFQELSGVVASARLDCLVGLLCRTSREKAAGLITAGAVQRNHWETYSQGERVEEGDVLSIRKYGKFIIDQLGPLTAKGRLSVKCRKYQ